MFQISYRSGDSDHLADIDDWSLAAEQPRLPVVEKNDEAIESETDEETETEIETVAVEQHSSVPENDELKRMSFLKVN